MGITSGSGVSQLYVVYQEAGGLNIDYAVAPITTADTGSWAITAPWELVSSGSNGFPHRLRNYRRFFGWRGCINPCPPIFRGTS